MAVPRPAPRRDDPRTFARVFLNSWDPLGQPVDRLAGGSEAKAFLPGWAKLPRDTDWSALADVLRPWRNRLRAAVQAEIAGDAAPLRRLLRQGLADVAWQASADPALTFRPSPDQPADAQVRGLVLQGLAEELQATGAARLRQCRSLPCVELFFDHSKRGAQHFCCKRCATRVHVARHRQRRTA